jgi:ubiquinol-cytochrome c reductase cytochrome c1 subunit
MKKLIFAFLMAVSSASMAAGGGAHLDHANIDLTDQASLQRGAKLYVNYCQGCHSLQFQRYQRMADDIGLTYDEVLENMVFNGGKIADHMTTSIDNEAAAAWFGTAPPDLSVIARARGVDWIYTYLRSFYMDEKRPFGVNNTVFADVGMPHVMWELQGMQKANFKDEVDSNGNKHTVFEGFELVKPGKLSAEEFDAAMRDLTAFLSYVGEPVQVQRRAMGIYVLLFLAVFTVLAYLMKKEFWKDVH